MKGATDVVRSATPIGAVASAGAPVMEHDQRGMGIKRLVASISTMPGLGRDDGIL